MNDDKNNYKTNVCQFGGDTSAFTKYEKPVRIQRQQLDSIIDTRSNRKTAFAKIKRLFSLQTTTN
jgi:hypothetical protein